DLSSSPLPELYSVPFFFTLPPPPPSPTLFPYTTLFRSPPLPLQHPRMVAVALRAAAARAQRRVVTRRRLAHEKIVEDLARRGRGDRKSTRLNSSHVAISYAVFCLKKKKKNQRLDQHRES